MLGKIYVTFMSFDPGRCVTCWNGFPRGTCASWSPKSTRNGSTNSVLAGETDRAGVAAVLAQAMTQGVELLDSGVPQLAGPGVAYVRKHPSLVDGMDAPGRDLSGLDRR